MKAFSGILLGLIAASLVWPLLRLDAAYHYRLVLEKGSAGARYHGVAEEGVPFRDIAGVIGRRLNVPVVAKSPEEVADHFGLTATRYRPQGDRSAGRLEVKVEGQIATITFSEYSGVKEIEAHLVPMAMDVSSDVLAAENRGRKLAHSFVALELVSRKTE